MPIQINGVDATSEQLLSLRAEMGITDPGAVGLSLLQSGTRYQAQNAMLGVLVQFVSSGDSIATAIANGYRNIYLEPGGSYTVNDLVLPAGTTINGMGATISPTDTTKACFLLNFGSDDVRVDRCIFVGQAADPNNTAYVSTHWGIEVSRAFRPRITNNVFRNWRGGAIGCVGSAADSYMNYGASFSENEYHNCYIGQLTTGRYEYGRSLGNHAYGCRVGFFREAGNWTSVGDKATACRNPLISANKAVDFSAGGIAAFVANSEHGMVSAFEGNHSSSGGGEARWNATGMAIPLVGGTTYDPGYLGIVVDGLLPPTLAGFAMYYCDFRLQNRPAMSGTTKLTSTVARNANIRADVAGVLELDGFTHDTAVTLTNAVIIDDRVASTAQLGQVKVGSGLSVAADGTLSAASVGGTTNISSLITEYGYISQLGDGLPTTQGWVQSGNNAAVTDPAAANFAGFAVATDGGIQSLIARDSSSAHNPNFGRSLTAAQKQDLYTNGGALKLRWKPYALTAGAAGLLGIYFPAVAGWTGWTGLNTRAYLIINPTISGIVGNLGTVNWTFNGAALNQANFDLTVYHDVEIRMFPAQNKAQLWVDGVQQGGDQTWASATDYGAPGTTFADKLFWASGSTGGTTIGMWIRSMSASINGDLGVMTTPATDASSVFNIGADWRNYTLNVADVAYTKWSTIKGSVQLPVGYSLTIKRANSNVLINGGGSDVVIAGTGAKQSVSLTQTAGALGKVWVQD